MVLLHFLYAPMEDYCVIMHVYSSIAGIVLAWLTDKPYFDIEWGGIFLLVVPILCFRARKVMF
jgi:hypothetical protein